jgi:hypothetical protein
MSAVNDSEWLDTPDLCQALAISRSTLSRWSRRGLLNPGQHRVCQATVMIQGTSAGSGAHHRWGNLARSALAWVP